MDAKLKEELTELIKARKDQGLCNNIDDEVNIFSGFASGCVACGKTPDEMLSASIVLNYMRGESPFGFEYRRAKTDEDDEEEDEE